MTRRLGNALPAAAVGLAVGQALLEAVSVLAGWPVGTRQALRLAGFALDLLFTIEFLARLGAALGDRRAGRYLWREHGWLHLLTGAPLLVLVSGPWAAGLLLGPAMATTGVLDAARVGRALRLLRPARIAAGLRDAAQGMTACHACLLALLGSAVLALGLAALGLAGPRLPGLERELAGRQRQTARALSGGSPGLQALIRADPSLLVVREGRSALYSRHADAVYEREFALGDYRHLRSGGLELFFDTRAAAREQAAQDLLFQVLALLLLAVLYLFYAPHFARTVSDPLEVMRRGLAEDGFNLQVRVPGSLRQEEVFRLAHEYNERYLPLKERGRRGQAPVLLGPEDARLDGPAGERI